MNLILVEAPSGTAHLHDLDEAGAWGGICGNVVMSDRFVPGTGTAPLCRSCERIAANRERVVS